ITGRGFAVFTIASAETFVMLLRIILNAIHLKYIEILLGWQKNLTKYLGANRIVIWKLPFIT
ncbi:MAG: hypothetical protein K6F69_01430, partial [Treponema sp.]|nr:hypothetical protein [Treponema sp.]